MRAQEIGRGQHAHQEPLVLAELAGKSLLANPEVFSGRPQRQSLALALLHDAALAGVDSPDGLRRRILDLEFSGRLYQG